MEDQKIKENIYNQFDKGFHCAESMVNIFQELIPPRCKISCMPASGFCGGIGESKHDVCGALAGGIIALGSIYGRDNASEDIVKLKYLSNEFRLLFLEEFKSTVCKNVVENIENRNGYNGCRDVTAKAATMLYHLIMKNQQ